MADRSRDWFAQAERDLAQAKSSQKKGRHEWACFAAHQSAEKAVRALHLFLKQESWGHVVARLLDELPVSVSEDLSDKARVLDSFYIPTRYANGHPEGAPFERRSARWDLNDLPVPAEILVYTLSEWENLSSTGSRFARILNQEVVWTYRTF